MGSSRNVVLGIDSAELHLVEKWASEGSLPFLGSLLRTCPLVLLRTPIHVLQAGVWPSLLTGASPGRHGQYVLWSQIRNGSYETQVQPEMRGSLRRYYQFLADRGVRGALADVLTDVPVRGFGGMQIIEWGGEFRAWGFATEPRELAGRIARDVGDYPIPPGRMSGDSQAEHLELARLLEEGVRRKGALARWMLQQPGIDHVFCVFAELHKGAHWLWKYMDRSHVDYEDSPPALGGALRRLYEHVDGELAAIASQLGPQDNLLVLSDHGMQANYRGDHLAERFLETLGLLVRRGPSPLPPGVLARGTRGPRAGLPSAASRAVSAVKALVPPALKRRLKALTDRPDIDWRRTRVFRLPTDRNTYFRVNLRGREPQGCVQPGAEYEALLDLLQTELCALRNGSTGRPAVAEIFRMREIFPGDRADDLPDLAVQWSAESPIDSLQSPSVGTLSLAVRELRSGNHRPEGFLLVRGPAFVGGPQRLAGDILQVAPTLLQLHGVPLPAQFERGPLPVRAEAEQAYSRYA
jgi:predicted AlkP superfamily phosphohydrolase/phosphomutase